VIAFVNIGGYRSLSEVIGNYQNMVVKRAKRSSQKERIMLACPKIIEMMRVGVTIPEIQKRVKLDDIPYSSFHYHAQKIRGAAGIPDYADIPIPVERSSETPTRPALPDEEPAIVESPKPASDDEKPIQPKSVSPVKVVLDDPDKKVKPRRKGGKITPDLSVKKDEFDTSKWSSELK